MKGRKSRETEIRSGRTNYIKEEGGGRGEHSEKQSVERTDEENFIKERRKERKEKRDKNKIR